jgi:hypothetical protein
VAAFKDLCIDANDLDRVAAFWAGALGGTVEPHRSEDVKRIELPGQPSVWINRVPEPRRVKTRVHLDIRLPAADPSPLVALGATVISEPGELAWWVLEDPEGNAFCAMPPHEGRPEGAFELVVDAADPERMAAWWQALVGGELGTGNDHAWIVGPQGLPWYAWVFAPVPEPKTVKNRVHWDVLGTVEELVGAGATVIAEHPDWAILADPEGNEFCAFAPD